MKKIAALAEGYQVPLAPHCVTSELGATAAIPFFLIHEYYPNLLKGADKFLRKNWPGLEVEVEVDEKVLAECPKTDKSKWEWPKRGRLADGSIADY